MHGFPAQIEGATARELLQKQAPLKKCKAAADRPINLEESQVGERQPSSGSDDDREQSSERVQVERKFMDDGRCAGSRCGGS
eukprot:2717267-Rhodomonas_salina.4